MADSLNKFYLLNNSNWRLWDKDLLSIYQTSNIFLICDLLASGKTGT